MSLLQNSEGKPQVCWHGTCADFDVFYPWSYFAVDKHISDCKEFYEKLRRPDKKFISNEEALEKLLDGMMKKVNAAEDILSGQVVPEKDEKHSNFKIIPVHLKVKNPLCLSSWEFHLKEGLDGLVWGLMRQPEENSFETMQNANVYSDFIFKDSQTRSNEQVKNELIMGHLFSISSDEVENRYHLAAQRVILFLEKMGYDAVQYDYMKESVDAYRTGKIKDFDNRAYVVFRPEQIIRLDKKVEVPSSQPSQREKIELNKIFYRYQQAYQPYIITEQELMNRISWLGCIKNQLRFR